MGVVIFINSVEKQCGCHSYGLRTFKVLERSIKYDFMYAEPNDFDEMWKLLLLLNPIAVIYNFHPSTMAWLGGNEMEGVKRYVLWHEGSEHTNLNPDYWLYVDSLVEDKGNKFSIPRPLIEWADFKKPINDIPVISSFGFGFGSKNFGSIIQMVNDQFDEAIIRLHIPRAYYGDKSGEATAGILPGIWNEMKKPNIKLEITHNFLTDNELLKFLSESDLNIFLYDQMEGRGLSSVIDYALSVDVPIAINYSAMFRHVQCPEMNAMGRSLKDIINGGTDHLKQFRELWGNANLIKKYEQILNDTL